MRATLLSFPFVVTGGGCCYEGFMRPSTRDVTLAEVPSRVRAAFERGYESGDVARIQHASVKSRCTGDADWFRFHLADGQAVTLDGGGRLTKWSSSLGD
jgi:hypothetical protein